MKLVITSDTHGIVPLENVPDGDVFIHCGDCLKYGRLPEVHKFRAEMGALPHKHKILVPGNHDLAIEGFPAPTLAFEEFGIDLLINREITIEGWKFYGTPHVPTFGDWAFMKPEETLKDIYDQIPLDTNVLITHGPCKAILDDGLGSVSLYKRFLELKSLRVHCFGHIHEGHGLFHFEHNDVTCINAAALEGRYKPREKIFWEIEI